MENLIVSTEYDTKDIAPFNL